MPLVVVSVRPEASGCLSVVFKRPPGFKFYAGDWIDLGFTDLSIRGGVTYSLSSAPTEPELMITFRAGVSEVKKALAVAKPGDRFTITQYGNDYGFHLREQASATFIAGGVGIAPFRSMIKQMADTADTSTAKLLYFNSTADFVFQRELDAWSKVLPNLSIRYVVTASLKKKDKHAILAEAAADSHGSFYIAGPEAMVETIEHALLDQGIKLKDIKIDSFSGY